MSVLMAGGGIRGGQTVGATNIKGQYPVRRPVKPADILATIYHQLGIPDDLQFTNRTGRPIPILRDGRLLSELVQSEVLLVVPLMLFKTELLDIYVTEVT